MTQHENRAFINYLKKFSRKTLEQIIIRGNIEDIFNIPEDKIATNRRRLPEFIAEESIKRSAITFSYSSNAIPVIKRILENIVSEEILNFLNSDDNSLFIFILLRLSKENEISYALPNDIMQCHDMDSLKEKLRTTILSINEDPEKINNLLRILLDSYFLSKSSFNFRWLKLENKEQTKWAIEYILDNDFILKEYETLPINLIKEKNYIYIVEGIFHSLCFYEREQAKLYERFRRAWNQHKFRKKAENENKVSVNFLMKSETKKRLQEVADYHNTNMIDVIEKLINSSWEAFNEGSDSL